MYGGGGEFDSNAAFDGAAGGFMPQATQAPESSSSNKKSEVRSLLPLTLKQCNSASTNGESTLSIDGVDINTVTIVGRLANIENRINQVDFVVDDGTGWIDCARWCNDPRDTEQMEAVKQGMYVRVHGHLKSSFQGKRTVTVFSLRPVTDFNEIVHHFTECMYVHMYNTKSRGAPITQATNTPRPQPYSTMATPAKPYQSGSSNQSQNQYNDPMFNVRQTVLNFVNQPKYLQSQVGVHYEVIAKEVGIPLSEVKDALDYLANEGTVYYTTNENWYKSITNA